MHGDESEHIAQQWLSNVTRFAAYKTYCATQDIRRIADEEGGDMDYIKAMFHAYNRYQAVEYNTAVARARTGKQWQQFSEDDNMRLFPNIKWLPSRSATPREEHMPFYNRVWAKDDPFWTHNQPGTLWNCKCDWEQTDEDTTDGNPASRIVKPGLDENPATSGQIFTDTASYVRRPGSDGRAIVEGFKSVWEHINDYIRCRDNDDYTDVAFRWDNGGLKATHEGHISHDNPNEERFFSEKLSATQLENECQNILFKSGHSAILLNEITLAANGDILPALDLQMDGRLMDIRSITKNNAHTIRNVLSTKNNQIKRFVSKTGMDADTVCLYFHDSTLYSKTLITAGIEEYVDLVKTKNKIQHVICVVAGNTNVIEFNVK